jgi:hypothetical protein
MELRSDIVSPETVTLPWIEKTFEGAFMPIVDRLADSLWVKGKRLVVQVILAREKSAINFVLTQPLVPGTDFLQALIAANNCNVRFGWCRFYIMQTSDRLQHQLIVDATLTIERGLVPYHLVKTFELLELVGLKGVEAEFMKLIP